MDKTKVVVLMGGRSAEHEVSLMSGKRVVDSLDKEKYEVFSIVLSKEGREDSFKWVDEIKPDLVFLALHGEFGEDGRIQGWLETMNLKYTGSGVLASALGMNKIFFKRIIEDLGIRTADWKVWGEEVNFEGKCVVKPVNCGSSVGVSIVKDEANFEKAIKEAKKFDKEIIIEEFLEGVEVSCGVLGNEAPVALPVIEIIPKNDFFDYDAKYSEGMSKEICPARLDQKITDEVMKISVEIFKVLGFRGYARIDFIISKNKPYVLEINTLPGLTPNSLLPKEAMADGISYTELLDKIISLALEK
ncbi:hypothetical protein A2574_03940 [Candidatus Shapirobacteria bacterium RIFOXYD1_FULL_38_32]|uniref:D-alanine--D-alanine ligase n=1 Tax=Candidatus Shapirobacteria bacterium GW2011_GWE1_38_92 TaxID=1618489 RepID=A0A0G0PNB6_9BACT|nr:MAG: D-alanine-D-alanine ligase [Candidatus Shapirobacteria bacterium GW2011_GWE1_38_92]OGL55261.1 MAG: hypothetical protein A2195_02090 [Candidatus Shapirobacteria bacterium RIFOXYA1_FULL_39_17]OGL58348.1 MAG: hypothetical protein A2574_03940 [Candidatus Shapirobacteria bacterium RIFOXYD1_FULL_38_32]HAP37846.1 D-alanine--D-alanine ligase [Candidatus Shapirobacteria bacterium]HCU55209.1 D-alanine--D-alanine ligase [Candidatus Shapirobacteria bacterium]